MIKAAIEKILELSDPKLIDVHGDFYCDRNLKRIDNDLRGEPLWMNTLSSLISYIKKSSDLYPGCSYIVHVVSPSTVELVSSLDGDRKRETLAVVSAELPDFAFDAEIEHESFIIGVRSKFIDGGDKATVLRFAGTVKNGSVTQYNDDGITQKATVKRGVSTLSEEVVPSPCLLIPYRTFTEVEQPASEFIFRMKENSALKMIYCALYEADGGAWKVQAMKNIHDHLTGELDGMKNVLIIS